MILFFNFLSKMKQKSLTCSTYFKYFDILKKKKEPLSLLHKKTFTVAL